jgi:feruloyl esterase
MKDKIAPLIVHTMLVFGSMGETALASEQLCKDLGTGVSSGQITKAVHIPAGPGSKDPMTALTGASMAPLELPAHCLVQGRIEPRTGADGKPYAINFEMRLPEKWQRRLLFQGGGAMDGFLANALGRITVTNATAKPALSRGYAVVSMDGGHQGLDASFARDQQARLDFAYAAIGKVWKEAKAITRQYYRQPAQYTYFMGCSNGGREAMIAAQRYPTEFDGIVAGNPGFRLSCAAVSQAWDSQVLMSIAPRDPQGRPVLAQGFRAVDLQLVAARVIETCDALDGLRDGLINNHRACKFDPNVLECTPGQDAHCLRKEQVDALSKLFAGPRNSAGKSLYSSWPFDSGIAADGWRAWKLGFSTDAAKPDALNIVLGADSLKNYFMTPPNNSFDTLAFDFDRHMDRIAQTGALNDAASTYMTTFKARGGKMLIYQGVSDPVFSANDISTWYEQLEHDTDAGDAAQTREWARLFMVPGMTHCGDGPALNEFDPLAAIESWVEHGRAPDSMPATGRAFPGKTQPLCPYPQFAKYIGGDVDKLSSYRCAAGK